MRVALIGATGAVGRRAASELLRDGKVEKLSLIARRRAPLDELASVLRGRAEIRVHRTDASSTELTGVVKGHDVFVSCAGPGYLLEEACVTTAMRTGVHYVSLNDDLSAAESLPARRADIGSAGIAVVSGAGASPGITDLLIALARRSMDEIEEVEVSFAASSSDSGGPATELHFLAMLDDGRRLKAAGSDDASGSPHPVYFPEPIGWIETYPAGHPEQLWLGGDPAGAVRFRIGLAEKAVMDAARAGVAARATSGERRRRAWLASSKPLRPLLEALSPGAAPWTGLRVDVHGRAAGKSRTESLGVVDHLTNLASIPIAQVALRLPGSGLQGLLTAAQIGEPKDLLKSLSERGIRFAKLEPHAW